MSLGRPSLGGVPPCGDSLLESGVGFGAVLGSSGVDMGDLRRGYPGRTYEGIILFVFYGRGLGGRRRHRSINGPWWIENVRSYYNQIRKTFRPLFQGFVA